MLRGGCIARKDKLWYEPTLADPRTSDSDIVGTEVFGPVPTFRTFEDEAEAVALANDTQNGLAGAVCARDDAVRTQRIGRAVRSGTMRVDCFLVRGLTAPFVGRIETVIDREADIQ